MCAYCQWLWRRGVAFKFGEELGGGVRPPSWEGVFMGVVCREVIGWVGKFLAKTSSLRFGWGIE